MAASRTSPPGGLGQPPRRHPPRLPTPPNPLRRGGGVRLAGCADQRDQPGRLIGWTSAIATYGPVTFGVMLACISPTPFFAMGVVYALIAGGISWYYYARPVRRGPDDALVIAEGPMKAAVGPIPSPPAPRRSSSVVSQQPPEER